MAITVLTDQSTAQNSRTLSYTIPSLAVGDVIVVGEITWDSADTMNAPSGTGLTFTSRVATSTAAKTRLYIWTAVAASSGTNVVVSSTANTSSIHNGVLWQCPTADGYSLAGTPNTAANSTLAGSAAAQVSLSGASGNLACVIVGDWNGVSGASRAWLVSATEDLYQFSSGNSTQYGSHCTLTGASTTVGLSAPTTGCSNAIAAIEILKSAGGSFTGSASPSTTVSISAAGGAQGSASRSTTVGITATGATGTAQGATQSTSVGISAAGGGTGSTSQSTTVGISAAGGALGSASQATSVSITASGSVGGSSPTGDATQTTTIGITADGGTQGSASRATTVGITAAGGGLGDAARATSVSITASGTVTNGGSAQLATSVGITASGIMSAAQGSSLSTAVSIVASGSLVSAQYRVVFPTHEEPMRHEAKPIAYMRLTHALSLVKLNGTWRAMRVSALTPEQLESVENGSTLFVGGYEYVVDQTTSSELVAAGFTTEPL